jgi:probable HAF family extracellular repeat protein
LFTTIDVPGATTTNARGINDSGQVVGTYVDSTGTHGFLYTDGSFTTIDVPVVDFETFFRGAWFCLAIKNDLASQIEHREVASSVRINFPQAERAALPAIESQRHGNSAAEGVRSREGFCLSTQVFTLRSNYTKSNQLRGVPVPNMYLFGTVSTKNRA